MQCIHCGHSKIYKRGKTKRGTEKYQRYGCEKCKRSFSELTGTIYEDRHLTRADIDLILQYQNQGMNFTQVAKVVGVSTKTVSNLLKVIAKTTVSQPTNLIQPFDSQTLPIMTNIRYPLIFITSLFGMSGCLNTTATSKYVETTLNPDRVSLKLDSGSKLLEGKSDNGIDIYETKYILCDSYCADRPKRAASITTVTTWGKPTEIGFIYAEQFYPQSMTFNPRKKIIYNGITITNMQAQLVIKSRGVLPPLKQPLGTVKFTPVETLIPMFFPEKSNPPLVAEAKGSVRTGNIKILSVRKLSPSEANVYIKQAKNPPNLATIGAIEESAYGEVQKLIAYYQFYKNKPDIKPQQVEKISELVNTTPQVIQIKKW